MCGPSGQEEAAQGLQASITSTLNAHYNEYFAKQSSIIDNMMKAYTPISEAGPDQQGIGPQELAALNTQAREGVGSNYAKASQALNNVLGARGGGNEFLPTGGAAALRAGLASSAANQASNEELGITKANYDIGRQNWQQANQGLLALSGQLNPNAIAGETTGSNTANFQMANKINAENEQMANDIAGGVTALAGAALPGIGNLDFQGGSTFGEQVGNFFGGIKG